MYFLKKQTSDNLFKVDIRDFKKKGFKYGLDCTGTISTKVNNLVTNSIAFTINDEDLTLIYFYRNSLDDSEHIRQQIKLSWLQCHYGSLRAYFICPQCAKRVTTLYNNKYFCCRTCCNLAYKSQQEDKTDRLIRKIRKVRQKLNAEDDLFSIIWNKPKGMHHKTFYRLIEENNLMTKQYFNSLLAMSRSR